jgi:hypothetical protein
MFFFITCLHLGSSLIPHNCILPLLFTFMSIYVFLCVQANSDDDDTPDLGFNFTEDSREFSEASQSQMSQPGLLCNDYTLNATSLTGDKLLSQPYKVTLTLLYFRLLPLLGHRPSTRAQGNSLTAYCCLVFFISKKELLSLTSVLAVTCQTIVMQHVLMVSSALICIQSLIYLIMLLC